MIMKDNNTLRWQGVIETLEKLISNSQKLEVWKNIQAGKQVGGRDY